MSDVVNSSFAFPPGLILVLGAFLIPFLKGILRPILLIGLPLLALILIWTLPEGNSLNLAFLDYSLNPVRSSAEGRLFATIFSIMAMVGGLYAWKQANTLELTAAFIYAGSAIGVTFAGDLITLFIFWEIMALGSTAVVWAAGTESAYRASMRYLLVHFMGGVILMAGITAHVMSTGDITFTSMKPDSIGKGLILIGFLINAGAPPFSAWIADTYPEASPSGTVFLSAFTTKTAVFALLVGFPGTEILIPIGLFMVFYGIIYALLENDMRRILAYSIVNQVGFMVTAIGIGTTLSLNGASAHAFAHIIYKALLLMSAGSVLMMTGNRKCTDLGGLFQSMPQTALHGIIGALAISAVPFTSGFVTKSLETSAAAYEGMVVVWLALMAASAGVFLHAGIKFPWFVFFQKDSGLRPPEPPINMRMAMTVFSFLCIFIGIFPNLLYKILPYPIDYEPYTAGHIVTQFQVLLFAGFAFFALLPLMKRTLTITLDFDWFYRRFLSVIGTKLSIQMGRFVNKTTDITLRKLHSIYEKLQLQHGPQGILGNTSSSSSMVLWVAVILVSSLLLYFY